MDYKEALGFLGITVGFIGYIPYVRNILIGKTKPHAFSWFIWCVLTAIAFSIQWTEGAGAGSWVTGVTSLLCCSVFVLSLRRGVKTFPMIDWIVLLLALLAIGIWQISDNPVTSIILVTSIDVVAYVPTIRKAYLKPFEETATLFGLDAVKWVFSFFALETLTIATWLYPTALTIVSVVTVSVLLVRRKMVGV